MKIVINTTNLYFGGGVQVALSFINELKFIDTKHQYFVFLSQAVAKQLEKSLFPNNFVFYMINESPASLKHRKKVVKELDALENSIKPDIVFTIFGPSYWKPQTVHLMGFANGWVLQKDSVAYNTLDFLPRLRMRLWVEYVEYYAKRDASYYVLETLDAKERLSHNFSVDQNSIFTVGNSYSSFFEDKKLLSTQSEYYISLPKRKINEYRLLLISHNQPSKNIKIVNELLPFLKHYHVQFVFTIDAKSFSSLFPSNPDEIINIGPVAQKSCPSLYEQCDALFLPTLLEIFTASYPEAMKMKKPILTSNYSFATEVCADAALYFDPLSADDIAKKIIELSQNRQLENELILKGEKRLLEFETAKSRAEKYLDICEKIVQTSSGGENV